jgi:hypothetical protein
MIVGDFVLECSVFCVKSGNYANRKSRKWCFFLVYPIFGKKRNLM